MGTAILIYGKSGAGKSRSLKNFAEDEILFINCIGKHPPFRKNFKYALRSCDYNTIMDAMKRRPKDVNTIVLDDAGYLLTSQFMEGHAAPKKGSSAFDLYNDIADRFYNLLIFIRDMLPGNVLVYIIMHESTSDYGETKLRTIGKLLDEKVCIEGMVTVCLRCMKENGKHFFRTQSDGMDISKSPEDMFAPQIENDLKAVDTAIREFYSL